MKELLEWLEEYRLNTLSLMAIGDYEQGQIDVLTDVINRVDPNRCSYCGQKDGNHKISCPTTKSVVYLEEHRKRKQALIDMMQADEKDGLYNKAIPTLEGDEAEEFIRKADENVKEMRKRIVDKATELQERYDNDLLKMQELISKEANVVTEEDLKRMSRSKNQICTKTKEDENN